MFHALHSAFPDAEIAWVVQGEYAGLLEGLDGLSRVFRFDRGGGLAGLVRLWRELRSFAPEISVDAQGNLKSALVTLLGGAPRRVGYARADWQEKLGALSANERAEPSSQAHLVGRVRDLARHIAPTGEFRTSIGLAPGEIRVGRTRLAELLPGTSAPILLHLSSPEDTRGWPLDHWEELTRELLLGGERVLLLSGPGEEAAGRELRARLGEEIPGLTHWIGQKGLRELAAVFAAAGELGGTLIACDSGPMHLAWSSGLRVLVLEGPQTAGRTGPWPPKDGPHRELRAFDSPPCAPCIARRCSHARGPVCMNDLRPSQVLETIRALP